MNITKSFSKITLTFILILILSIPVISGENEKKDEIRKNTLEFFNLTTDLKCDQSLNYVYSLVFGVVNKEELVKNLDKILHFPGMHFAFNNFDIKSVSDIITKGSIAYSMVEYSYNIKLKIDKDVSVADAENTVNQLLQYLGESKMFISKVRLTPGDYSFVARSNMYAVNSPTVGVWQFLRTGNEFYNNLVDKYIPAEIRKQFEKDNNNGKTKYYEVGKKKHSK